MQNFKRATQNNAIARCYRQASSRGLNIYLFLFAKCWKQEGPPFSWKAPTGFCAQSGPSQKACKGQVSFAARWSMRNLVWNTQHGM